jgi:hypothetical protein
MHIMKSEKVHHVKTLAVLENILGKKDQYIDYDQVFYNWWNSLETAHPNICHTAIF